MGICVGIWEEVFIFCGGIVVILQTEKNLHFFFLFSVFIVGRERGNVGSLREKCAWEFVEGKT